MLTPENTHHTGGGVESTTVWMVPSLTGLNSVATYKYQHTFVFCRYQSSQTGYQSYKECERHLFFKKMGHPRPHFLYFRLFYKKLTGNFDSINVVDDWIWTADLCCRKRPLCQLSHNHCLSVLCLHINISLSLSLISSYRTYSNC